MQILNMTLGSSTGCQYLLDYISSLSMLESKAIAKDWFGNKADKSEVSATSSLVYLGIIFLAVGVIEVAFDSVPTCLVNIPTFWKCIWWRKPYCTVCSTLVPQLKWILPVPFYFMEVLIGLVQALVFMLLVSVYIGLICNHDEGEHH